MSLYEVKKSWLYTSQLTISPLPLALYVAFSSSLSSPQAVRHTAITATSKEDSMYLYLLISVELNCRRKFQEQSPAIVLFCVSFPCPKFIVAESIFIISIAVGYFFIVLLPYDFVFGNRFSSHFLFLNSGYASLYPTIFVSPSEGSTVFLLLIQLWTVIDNSSTVCFDNENIIVTILRPNPDNDRGQFIACWFIVIVATASESHCHNDTQSYSNQRLQVFKVVFHFLTFQLRYCLATTAELIFLFTKIYKMKKAQSHSVTRSTCRGSGIAQFVETSNAESPTPVYVYRKHS